MLSRLQHDAMRSILGDKLVLHEIDRVPPAGLQATFKALQGYIDGITAEELSAILTRIAEERVGRIFVDGSNLGRLTQVVKQRLPSVEVLTFFHNVEARFFLGALRESRSVRALGVLVGNYAAERAAVRYSDRLIALSRRDSEGLMSLYGRAATDIFPMAVDDKLVPRPRDPKVHSDGGYALFVGGAFYANRAGIKWFADNVSPEIGLKTCIVGRGFDEVRAELEREGRVEVVGGVDHLDEWYRNARIVVAPIFDGSGMKTKTAEALMFGKKIVGTPESFSGYEDVAAKAGWVCNTKDEFVEALRLVESMPIPAFDAELRQIYEQNYSRKAAERRLAKILA